MIDCLIFGLSNAVIASLIAIVAILVARWGKHPHLAHALWLLVFIKLITPPVIPMNILNPRIGGFAKENHSSASREASSRSTAPGPETRLIWANKPEQSDPPPRDSNPATRTHASSIITNTDGPTTSVQPVPARSTLSEMDGVSHRGVSQHEDLVASSASQIEPSSAITLSNAQSNSRLPAAIWSWSWVPRGLVSIWCFGTFFLLMRSWLRLRTFHRLVEQASPADARLRQFVARLSERLGLKAVPSIRVVSGNLSPMVFATGWRTYLIIPRELVDWLSNKGQFETLVAHELAHLRRHDHWVRRLELLATCAFWWLPTVWLAKQGIREAEEEICDAWVVATLPKAHRTYAEALLNTADFLNAGKLSLPPMTSAISHFRFIKRRIVMIMQGSVPTHLAWSGRLLVWVVAAACLPLTIGFAQSSDKGESTFPPVEGVVAAKKADAQEKLVKRIVKQDDGEAIDQEELAEILAEVREELQSELGGLDEELREAMKEVQEELQSELKNAPPELKKMLAELDIDSMLEEAMADAPKPVRAFVESLNIDEAIAESLRGVDLDDIEIDEEQLREIKEELEQELGQELKAEMREMSRELAEARREVQEAMKELPPQARAMLKQLDLESLLEESLGESSPMVREIIEEVGVLEIVEEALNEEGESNENDDDETIEEVGAEDELTDAEERLERRLEALMQEMTEIRKELKRVKRLRK